MPIPINMSYTIRSPVMNEEIHNRAFLLRYQDKDHPFVFRPENASIINTIAAITSSQ